ncbi:MAG: hypothetical protein AAGA00_07350 [Pseudomonadota bacterium]
MPTVREARPRDVQKFCRFVAPSWFIGVVAEGEAGDVIGAGWVVWGDGNRPWLCFEGGSRIRAHKMLIARWSVRLVGAAQTACNELYTIEDRAELNGSRWLEWLGFRDTGEVRQGNRILKWQKHFSH